MAIEVFNRQETKYLLSPHTAPQLMQQIAAVMRPDKYNAGGAAYTIANLYYDTPDSHLIRTSLSKPRYKEKLRLRAYGLPAETDLVYVEIKKKFNGIVNKRRSGMYLAEAYAFLTAGQVPALLPHMNGQVLHETAYLLSRLQLTPQVYIAYDRIAFHDPQRTDLRISFDTKIRTRRTDLDLARGDFGEPLLEDGAVLMEIKALHTMPAWLTALLCAHQVYPCSFSKYGREYHKHLAACLPAYSPVPLPAVHPLPFPRKTSA